MSTFTPNFNLETPAPNTQFKNLGAEMQRFALSVDSALASFDYNGADPNLLASRVAQLETKTAPIVGRFEGGGYYRAKAGMQLAGATWTVLSNLTAWEPVTTMPAPAWASGIRVPQAGLYRITLNLVVSANLSIVPAIKLNDTAASKVGALVGASVTGFAGETFCNMSREVRLVAGDILTPAVYVLNNAGPYGVNPGEATSFIVEYLRP